MKREKNQDSVFISLVLRHKPDAAGITLDEHGWADVQELIAGVNGSGRKITVEMLEEIVKTDEKQRYSFDALHKKIRANQGHSIPVDIQLLPVSPPDYLYHGTATRFLDSIQAGGILHQKRQYVHLSDNVNTAFTVGSRHGEGVVLTVRAQEMYLAGHPFWLSENKVWLCKTVPVKYIEFEQE